MPTAVAMVSGWVRSSQKCNQSMLGIGKLGAMRTGFDESVLGGTG